jgi:nucleoside-diphosphate-sugar epimerase
MTQPLRSHPDLSSLAGSRVLLIGGAGFIGHNLALGLRAHGAETLVVDNLVVNNLIANVSDSGVDERRRDLYLQFLLDRFRLLREAGVHLRNVDARLAVDLNQAFAEFRPTKVVHLAAISSAIEARHNPGLCFDLQLVTLRNALEAIRFQQKDEPIEISFMSSSTVYGDFDGKSVDESTRPQPHGIYANAKYMGERLLRTYAWQYQIPSTVIRPSALYGERCISRRVSQIFIENALAGRPLLLEGGGSGMLDFTHVDDLVHGILLALALPKAPDYTETFNLTYGNARSITELADVIRTVIPDVVIEERPRAEDKPIRGTLEIARAETVLGFSPRWPLEIGYRRYCEWYAEQWRRVSAG